MANKWSTYARYAEEAGAECILSACSSVGDIAERAAGTVSVPVVRIDDAMADLAVSRGRRIGVAATLETTMRPTLNLLHRKAADQRDSIQLIPLVVSEAYAKLMDGDQKGHDELLAALQRLARMRSRGVGAGIDVMGHTGLAEGNRIAHINQPKVRDGAAKSDFILPRQKG